MNERAPCEACGRPIVVGAMLCEHCGAPQGGHAARARTFRAIRIAVLIGVLAAIAVGAVVALVRG